jgi:hypothetical protein
MIMGLVMVAAALTGEPVGTFSRDLKVLAAEAGVPLKFYAGSVSVLNSWVWSSGAALSLTVAHLRPRRYRWLGAFGLLLLTLAADDSFLLHETVGPSHGIPEEAFYVFYALAGAALLVAAVRSGPDGSTVAFLVGGGFLAGSVVMDVVLADQHLVEDGFKLLGALVWLTVPLMELERLRRGARHAATAEPGIARPAPPSDRGPAGGQPPDGATRQSRRRQGRGPGTGDRPADPTVTGRAL